MASHVTRPRCVLFCHSVRRSLLCNLLPWMVFGGVGFWCYDEFEISLYDSWREASIRFHSILMQDLRHEFLGLAVEACCSFLTLSAGPTHAHYYGIICDSSRTWVSRLPPPSSLQPWGLCNCYRDLSLHLEGGSPTLKGERRRKMELPKPRLPIRMLPAPMFHKCSSLAPI